MMLESFESQIAPDFEFYAFKIISAWNACLPTLLRRQLLFYPSCAQKRYSPTVYFLCSIHGEILYIGLTRHLGNRIASHRKNFGKMIFTVGFVQDLPAALLDAIETRLIRTINPPLNKAKKNSSRSMPEVETIKQKKPKNPERYVPPEYRKDFDEFQKYIERYLGGIKCEAHH